MKYTSALFSCILLSCASAGFAQAPVPLNVTPSRIVGHPNPEQNLVVSGAPNLVEGREFNAPQGIALDLSASPPSLYLSDFGNNRVLAWRDATSFQNGQAADLVIGQVDMFRTSPQGPGTTFQTGLTAPMGLAVQGGDLYIADSGNNRVLRFRKPFQNAGNLFPDMVIGQPNFNSRVPNYPNNSTTPTNQGLSLIQSASAVYQVSIAFDSGGNLWLTDPGNRRVLRFTASDISNAVNGPVADREIGQLDFNTLQPAVTTTTQTTTNVFGVPSTLAFDAAGRLFVSDSDISVFNFSRVLVFLPPFSNGMAASRIMGVFPPNQPATTQDQAGRTKFAGVNGIFFIPGSTPKVGLLDQGYSRILLFDPYDKWPDPATAYSPLATTVVGQTSFTNLGRNGASNSANFLSPASATVLNNPGAAAFSGTDLFVADSGNHRVLDLPLQNGTFGAATRVLGQDRFDMMAPNLIEGREFNFTNGSSFAEGGYRDRRHRGYAASVRGGLLQQSRAGLQRLSPPGCRRPRGYRDRAGGFQ